MCVCSAEREERFEISHNSAHSMCCVKKNFERFFLSSCCWIFKTLKPQKFKKKKRARIDAHHKRGRVCTRPDTRERVLA